MKKVFIFLIICSFVFVSCSKKPEVRIPADVSMKKGLELFAKEDYYNAIPEFENTLMESESPEMAEKAQLFLADSYFLMEEYDDAVPAYELYLEIYGESKDADRAMLRLGLSNYERLLAYDKDMKRVEDSLKIFKELNERYPQYAEEYEIDKKITELVGMLAKRELYVAKFYFRIKKPDSALGRLEYILENYKDVKEVYEEAMYLYAYRLSKKDGKEMEAVNAYKKFLDQFPKSENAKEAATDMAALMLKVTEKLEEKSKEKEEK